jgi:hypothetical protein
MNQHMLDRILAFEPLYAATLPPPPPVLVRQHADRDTEDSLSDLSDLDYPHDLSDSDETG